MNFQKTPKNKRVNPFSCTSAYPVNYQTGRIKLEATDMTLPSGAVHYFHWRGYDNLAGSQNDGKNGFGWKTNLLPKLTESTDGDVLVEFFKGKKVRFSPDDQGRLVAPDNCSDTISLDATNRVYLVDRSDQTRWAYRAEGSNDGPAGSPASIVTPEGKGTRFLCHEDGNLWKVQSYLVDAPQQVLAELEYDYTPEKRIRSLTRRLFDKQTDRLAAVGRIRYHYYVPGESGGSPGDLKRVVSETGDGDQWVDAGTSYYRYYRDDDRHKLRCVVAPQDYAALAANFGTEEIDRLDPQALLPFATKYYEYDEKGRVAKEIVEHGTRTITLEYTAFPKSADINAVCQKTVERHENAHTNIIYLNGRGHTLLKETLPPDETGEPTVVHWRVFDRRGRVLRHYHPEAIKGYRLVVGTTAKLDVEVEPNEGMIRINEFYENDSSYKIKRKFLRRGEEGTPILLADWDRERVDGKLADHPTARTEYADETGKEAITTKFAVDYHPNSKRLKRKTTLLPVVAETENGDGEQAERTEIFDTKGRTVWFRDEAGIVMHQIYDAISGKLLRRVDDVDTTRTADFDTPLPEGWTTPGEAGKHETTDYEYDFKGRMVRVLQPENEGIDDFGKLVRCRRVSWTVYDDIARTQRMASGYLELDDDGKEMKAVLVNPVSLVIRDADGHTTDHIQASRANPEGPLTANDVFPQESYISWTKNIYTFGKLASTRHYHAIPETGEGEKGVHYAETLYGYDVRGRQNRTVSPSGMISRTVYDLYGNAIQRWNGTNDDGATETDPRGNDSANDMRLVAETVYGRSEACATCGGRGDKVLAEVEHVDENTIRTTEYRYDWRGRQTHILAEPDENGNGIVSVREYDNLDQVVKTEEHLRRDDDKNDVMRLISRMENRFDARGNLWKTEQSVVNRKTGRVTRKRTSESWHDKTGRTIKQKHSGRKGYDISEYKADGTLKRSARIGEDGEVLVETNPVFDRKGRNIATTMKNRKPRRENAAKSRKRQASAPEFEATLRFTKQWFDPAGRVIASADYGFIDPAKIPDTSTIPESGDEVRVTRTIYDVKTGRILASVDSEGRQHRSFADAAGHTVKTIANFTGDGIFDPEKPEENITTEMRYDVSGNLLWQKDPLGNVTRKEYDAYGRLLCSIAPNGGRTVYEYDGAGRTVAVTDPMERTTRFEYDAKGRQVKTLLPKADADHDHPARETVYDEFGQVEARIDPLGNTTRFEYDDEGRTVKQIDANGGTTSFEYDDEGKLLSLTDPVGNTTSYEYDELGRMVRETNALGKARHFEYAPIGQLAEKTDRNGRVTRYDYDRFGRLVTESWLAGQRTIKRIAFDFDRSGSLARVVDDIGTVEYAYDVLGRRNRETFALKALTDPLVLRHAHDVLGRRTETLLTHGNENVLENRRSYDALGHVETLTQTGPTGATKTATYTYDLAGQRLGVRTFAENRNIYAASLRYDGMGRLEGMHYVDPASETLAKYGLTWDDAGRITNMDLDGEPAAYGYDATSQLTSATYETLPNESYAYDANGNRKNFVTGKNNQLTSDGEFRYTYDDEGNRIEKQSKNSLTRYEWDHRNRLVRVKTPKTTVEYQYDYLNRLVKRNDEFFVHDGWQIVCTLRNGKIENRWFWGANQDELLCENDNFVLCDHLGTVRKIVGANAKAVSALEYDAFGNIAKRSSSTGCAFKFTGKYFDDETGLQWNINRWYDATVGRWISEDPIGFKSGDGNKQRYAQNKPISAKDILGLWTSNVHHDKTFDWCVASNFKETACQAIATADEATDGLFLGPWPAWLIGVGNQSYHFNRNFLVGGDSRVDNKNDRFAKARTECSKLPTSSRDPATAAGHIGVGLHAIQDYYAHGDYGRIEPVAITLIHNSYGPTLKGAQGGPTAYPDDITLDAIDGLGGRPAGAAIKIGTFIRPTGDPLTYDYAEYQTGSQRITSTENRTKNELTEFYNFLDRNPTLCECRKYFTFL